MAEDTDAGLLTQVRERSLAERSVACYRTLQRLQDNADTDWHRHMLHTFRRHWWSEIVGDIEATMSTLIAEPRYRFHGSKAFGTTSEIRGGEATRTMYSSLYDAGYFPGGVLDDIRIAFADWGIFIEAKVTSVLPGAALNISGLKLRPDAAYQSTCQTAQIHEFDRDQGLMVGEVVYWDDPTQVFPARR